MYSTPVDLSFSYLRSAVESSFDIKKDQVDANKYIDNVLPKKRGVKRVTNRLVLPFYTIADIFFKHLNRYSHALNLKKPVSAFRAKKLGVIFDVESATKNSEAR
jgi:hypothetical protein